MPDWQWFHDVVLGQTGRGGRNNVVAQAAAKVDQNGER